MKSIFRILLTCLVVTGAATAGATRQSNIGAIQDRVKARVTTGGYAGALVEGQKLEATVNTRVAANYSDYATVPMRRADAYDDQGKYAETVELYKRALTIREKRSAKPSQGGHEPQQPRICVRQARQICRGG